MTTAVVILNWNGKHMLERFLPSVTANIGPDAEVIIADNGSTDDSLDFLQQNYPQLRVITFDRNYGFAEGYNRALAQIDAQYFVLLNDDVEVTPFHHFGERPRPIRRRMRDILGLGGRHVCSCQRLA